MSESDEITDRRILVALDASRDGLAALEAAAILAAELQAELQGLFVEDLNLLRLSRLPFAREIAYSSAKQRQLDLSSMERTLRAKAEEVRRALANTCQRVSVQWSFRITRGHVTRATLAAADEADLLIMGRESSPLPVTSSTGSVTPTGPIVVVYDGSAAGGRALETAARLASDEMDQVVFLPVAEGETRDEFRQHCDDWFRSRGIRAACDRRLVSDLASLVDSARNWHARVLLINRDSTLLDEAAIENLVNQLDCPIGLVR